MDINLVSNGFSSRIRFSNPAKFVVIARKSFSLNIFTLFVRFSSVKVFRPPSCEFTRIFGNSRFKFLKCKEFTVFGRHIIRLGNRV